MLAEPVAGWRTRYTIILRYLTPRMTLAVVVIDTIFSRLVDFVDGVEVVYVLQADFDSAPTT